LQREQGVKVPTRQSFINNGMAASSNQKVVLITGCSTGIGLTTAVMLATDAEKRFKVYATMRNLGKKEALETEGKDVLGSTLIIEQLDVCSEDQINKVVDDILAKEGKLDVLVNNAAFGWVGPVERQETEHIKSMYATNVFGPISLITKLIPVWKKSGTGQAITISSLVGLMGFPFSSVYSSSKFAMEGFMETVQLELHGYPNIKITSIEPGPVATKFADNAKVGELDVTIDGLDQPSLEVMKKYQNFIARMFTDAMQQSDDIAKVILEAITSNNPHARYVTNPNFRDILLKKYQELTGDSFRKHLGELYFGE